jgi:hypothetical protein
MSGIQEVAQRKRAVRRRVTQRIRQYHHELVAALSRDNERFLRETMSRTGPAAKRPPCS